MTSKGPFQPKPFYDAMILCSPVWPKGVFYIYVHLIKGWLETKNVIKCPDELTQAFSCALKTRVTGTSVHAAARWLVLPRQRDAAPRDCRTRRTSGAVF